MTSNRIRQLRKGRGLQQLALGIMLGTTQQTVSRMESGQHDIPTDFLIQMAKYFNVTTDYILGISDLRYNLECQVRMTVDLDEHYDIVQRYKKLTETNRKTCRIMLERLELAQLEEIGGKEEHVNVTDSNM